MIAANVPGWDFPTSVTTARAVRKFTMMEGDKPYWPLPENILQPFRDVPRDRVRMVVVTDAPKPGDDCGDALTPYEFKMLARKCGVPAVRSAWASAGILVTNASLTTGAGRVHHHNYWAGVVADALNEASRLGTVFVFLGRAAAKFRDCTLLVNTSHFAESLNRAKVCETWDAHSGALCAEIRSMFGDEYAR